MITILALVIAACAAPPLVEANSWQEYKVKDHSGSVVGEGIEFNGNLVSVYATRPAYLNMECAGDETVVRIEVRNFDFGVWPVALRWRVDEGAERTDTWRACDNGACIGLWNGQGIAFLMSLLGVNELDLTMKQRYAKPMKATFLVAGAGDAIRSVGRRCGWL